MGFDLVGGRRLLLAGGGPAWAWLIAGALAATLLVLLYRTERRLVSRRAGLALLGFRLAAAAVLVAFLFEPIAERTVTEILRSRLVLGVDLSDSMTTIDPARPEADRRKLAELLDLGPDEPSERLSRREVARRLVAGRWLKAIADVHEVEPIGFARESWPGDPQSLDALMRGVEPIDGGGATDWSSVLADGLRDDGEGVVGVVLLTDGRENAVGDPSGPIADRLAARGIPIYPVLIGSSRPPRDAAVAAVKASENVYKGDVAVIEATLKIDAPPGTELPVILERPGAEPIRKTAAATSDGSRPIVVFRVPMETVGAQTLSVQVGPLDDDARPDNDRKTVAVQVLDDKARVLLVDGEARWEFRYVRNALARDPRVVVDAVVFHQPGYGQGEAEAEGTYARGLPALREPTETDRNPADPLGSFDAIILGDVPAEDLSTETWERIDRYVAGRGGTLIVNAGPRGWPALLDAQDLARRMAPVIDPRPAAFDPQAIDPDRSALPTGVRLELATAATVDSWPMLQFAAETVSNQAAWATLPQLPWALAGQPKPGATVLAQVAGTGTGAGSDSGPEGSTAGSAVIAAQPYGLGKVLWVGTNGTWRWRYRVGDAYHHRFWGQAIRWAASGKLAAGNRLVRFGVDQARPRDDRNVRVQARFTEDARGIGPSTIVAARIFRDGDGDDDNDGDAVALVPLRARADLPGAFEGDAPILPAGRYVVRLDVPELADALRAEGALPEAPLEVVPRETSERVELAAHRDPLERLATATGGKVFNDADAGALPELLKTRTVERTRTVETPIWDQPLALALFFALLSSEWWLRKRAGLP